MYWKIKDTRFEIFQALYKAEILEILTTFSLKAFVGASFTIRELIHL